MTANAINSQLQHRSGVAIHGPRIAWLRPCSYTLKYCSTAKTAIAIIQLTAARLQPLQLYTDLLQHGSNPYNYKPIYWRTVPSPTAIHRLPSARLRLLRPLQQYIDLLQNCSVPYSYTPTYYSPHQTPCTYILTSCRTAPSPAAIS